MEIDGNESCASVWAVFVAIASSARPLLSASVCVHLLAHRVEQTRLQSKSRALLLKLTHFKKLQLEGLRLQFASLLVHNCFISGNLLVSKAQRSLSQCVYLYLIMFPPETARQPFLIVASPNGC